MVSPTFASTPSGTAESGRDSRCRQLAQTNRTLSGGARQSRHSPIPPSGLHAAHAGAVVRVCGIKSPTERKGMRSPRSGPAPYGKPPAGSRERESVRAANRNPRHVRQPSRFCNDLRPAPPACEDRRRRPMIWPPARLASRQTHGHRTNRRPKRTVTQEHRRNTTGHILVLHDTLHHPQVAG